MMQQRIELSWGGGTFDVLLDLRYRCLYAYSGVDQAAAVHLMAGGVAGGQNYYRSQTGLSGAGWVPARPYLMKVSGYRVDVVRPTVPPPESWAGGICVPIDYGTGAIVERWPVLATRDQHGDGVIYADQTSFLAARIGDAEVDAQDVVVDCILGVGLPATQATYRVQVAGKPPGLRRAVEAVQSADLRFAWPDDYVPGMAPFWNRLGLHRFAGDPASVYKVSGDVCRRKAPVPTEKAELQALAPANVFVLAPRIYLQGAGESFEAVGLFSFAGQEYDYEVAVTFSEAVHAMHGDYAGITDALAAGAGEKYERDRARERALAAEKADTEERYGPHLGLLVSLADALAAGNCEPGVRQFQRQYFPGRDSVTLAELMPHVFNPAVRRAIEYRIGH
jgi:hypothetical protein